MKDFALLASVVEHKKVFSREGAARYDLAKPGSLRVCLPDARLAQARSDYRMPHARERRNGPEAR
jgi:hypothetical protein